MDSDETELREVKRNVVPHPQTIRRRNRTLDLALDREILLLENDMSCDSQEGSDSEMSWDSHKDGENQENTNNFSCFAEGSNCTKFESTSSVESHVPPIPVNQLLNTSSIDCRDSLIRHEKLCSLLQSSNSSISSTSSSSSEDDYQDHVNNHQNGIPIEYSDSSDSSTDEDFVESCENLHISEPFINTHTFKNCENFNVKPLQEYFSNDKEIMFKEAELKICDVMLMIFSYSVRFSLSYKARRALIEMTKTFAGPEFSQWDISDYYLSKIFDPPDSVIMYNFWCPPR